MLSYSRIGYFNKILLIVIEKFLLYLQNWIDYLPLVSCNVVSFYVGRKVPRTKAAADSSELVDEFIFPRDKCM